MRTEPSLLSQHANRFGSEAFQFLFYFLKLRPVWGDFLFHPHSISCVSALLFFFSSGTACGFFWSMLQLCGLVGPITTASPVRPFYSALIITLLSSIALLVPSYHLHHLEPCNRILTDRMENTSAMAETDGCQRLSTA